MPASPRGDVSLPAARRGGLRGRHPPTRRRRSWQFVVHDSVDRFNTHTEKLGFTWEAISRAPTSTPRTTSRLVVSGGRAAEYIRNDADCQRIVQQFFSNDKPVAELCHAPLVLGAAGVLQGRRTAAYPALEPDVEAFGAT